MIFAVKTLSFNTRIKKMNHKEIIIAEHAGFCFGVRRAVGIVEKSLEERDVAVYSIGSLVHNDQVIEMLGKKGLKTVQSVDDIPKGGLLIIRSHGAPIGIINEAKSKGIEIIDATCPFVKKARMVAEDFYKKEYDVVICGDINHAEIIGINSLIDNSGKIINNVAELEGISFKKKAVGILSQTTYKISLLKETINTLLDNGVKHLIVENTICLDSTTKQKEIGVLAKKVDTMIVIGGKSSSNTNKLAEISRASGAKTYHIETAAELEAEWLNEGKIIGIAAGASTAQFLIDEVIEKIKNLIK